MCPQKCDCPHKEPKQRKSRRAKAFGCKEQEFFKSKTKGRKDVVKREKEKKYLLENVLHGIRHSGMFL